MVQVVPARKLVELLGGSRRTKAGEAWFPIPCTSGKLSSDVKSMKLSAMQAKDPLVEAVLLSCLLVDPFLPSRIKMSSTDNSRAGILRRETWTGKT